MFLRDRFALSFCLFFSFFFLPIQPQCGQEKEPSLNDAQTFADVRAYVRHEMLKHNPHIMETEERVTILADILLPASDKALEIAKENPYERKAAYEMKYSALSNLVTAGIEGAEQQLETFLNELDTQGESDALFFFNDGRYILFKRKVERKEFSVDNFDQFKSELKMLIRIGRVLHPIEIRTLGLHVAEQNNISGKQFVEEIVDFILSPQCTLSEIEKMKAVSSWKETLRLAFGSDPKLYGKTLEDKDFQWEDLRGKYVLIKFTATWCGPCKAEIPGMREAYEKYHDKGFEIVSVYLDSVEAVKKHVEGAKLPWIIISGILTTNANQPNLSEFYGIYGIPVMVLADKAGKIIMTEARGDALQARLAEIFE